MIRDIPAWWLRAYRTAEGNAANMPETVPLSRSWVSVGDQWLDSGEARLLASCVMRQVARNLIDAVLWWSVPLLAAIATLETMRTGHVVLAGLSGTMLLFWARIMLLTTVETVRKSSGWFAYARRLCQ